MSEAGMAKWKFTGYVSVRVEVEIEAPASFPTDPEAAKAEYEAARKLAKAEFMARASGPMDSAAKAAGNGGWNLEELESNADPIAPSP